MKVMFVGSLESHLVGTIDFGHFGQVAELPAALAQDAAIGGCAIIPADSPSALAFTADELRRFGPFGTHGFAPAEFLAKKNAAQAAYLEFARACREEHADALTPAKGE